MIPISSDPRWRTLLLGESTHQFKTATPGMLVGRLRRSLMADPSPSNYVACVEQARTFLIKYENAMRDEIAVMFPGDGKI
jgi:hypothetical protein